ncbi:hypothetical protein BKI52_30865 [marine bacterium AO1-C]|nr:hypothetical protein BKI52_30865 [marine bacterium AO1-C]
MTKYMNYRRWWILGIITCFGLVLLKNLQKVPSSHLVGVKQTPDINSLPQIPAINNIRENLRGRLQYQQQRLEDPATHQIPQNVRTTELDFANALLLQQQTNNTALRTKEQIWLPRGPYNVGGRTRALAIDVSNPNVILAGGASGGMWRSEDAGGTWVKTNPENSVQSTTAIVQDTRPGKTSIWYYSTGELRGNTAAGGGGALYRGNGIFKSTDGGLSWQSLASTTNATPQEYDSTFEFVWNLSIDTSNKTQDEVYAAGFGAISRSTDGGQTWTRVLGYDTNFVARYTNVVVSPQGVVYATLSNTSIANRGGNVKGFYRSVDGVNWTEITPPGLPEIHDRTVLAISPQNENEIYFLTYTPGIAGLIKYNLWKYTYVSGNGSGSGGTWENLSANIPALGGNLGNYDSQESYNMLIAFKPDNAQTMFIGGTNLYRSDNAFTSASSTRWIGGYETTGGFGFYPNHHPDQHSLVFHPLNPNRMFSGNDGGVFVTNDNRVNNVTWQSLNRGYVTTQFYSVAIDPQLEFVVGGMQDNGTYSTRNTDETQPWERLLGGDGTFCAIGAQSVYVSAQNGQIFRLAYDNSGEYEGFARIDPAGGAGYDFVNPFIINPENQFEMYLPAADTLWYNSNMSDIKLGSNDKPSTNWSIIDQLPNPDDRITALSLSTVEKNTLYYGTNNGKLYKMQNTNDPSKRARTEITGSAFPIGGYINCIALNPQDKDEVIVVFSNYNVPSIFHSNDGGQTWTMIGGNLEENPDGSGTGPSIRWITILPLANQAKAYLLGTSIGLYTTGTINGSSTVWSQEGQKTIGNAVVEMIQARITDGFVAVATHGRGVFSTRYSNPFGIPSTDGFALEQNFPNPFRKLTSIRYRLDEDSQVRLAIYNVQGQLIHLLVDAFQPAGNKTVIWSGETGYNRRVVSGMYYYELRVNDKKRTKRMLMLR